MLHNFVFKGFGYLCTNPDVRANFFEIHMLEFVLFWTQLLIMVFKAATVLGIRARTRLCFWFVLKTVMLST